MSEHPPRSHIQRFSDLTYSVLLNYYTQRCEAPSGWSNEDTMVSQTLMESYTISPRKMIAQTRPNERYNPVTKLRRFWDLDCSPSF